jgi:uncharacterized protein YkwD
MFRVLSILFAGLLVLSACDTPSSNSTLGSDGQPLPTVYKIRSGDVSKIQYRMLDSVNSLRAASGLNTVQLNANLTAAAATHSRDMANQNRPWHFGSDGSSPIDRVARSGYGGIMIGENISETYETETETLGAWMEEPGTRAVIMDPAALNMGFAWHQERGGKIWWTMVMGG